jgi:hypothetical protein
MKMARDDEITQRHPKPVVWIASSRKDLKKFPKPVKIKSRLKEAEKHHAEWAEKQ